MAVIVSRGRSILLYDKVDRADWIQVHVTISSGFQQTHQTQDGAANLPDFFHKKLFLVMISSSFTRYENYEILNISIFPFLTFIFFRFCDDFVGCHL